MPASAILEFYKSVCILVDEFEGALERDALEFAVASVDRTNPAAQWLATTYSRLLRRDTLALSPLRPSWIKYAIASFERALREPEQVWPAEMTDKRLVVRLHDRANTMSIRYDQLPQCRFWGHWFSFNNASHDRTVTGSVVHRVFTRLLSDLASIDKLERLQALGGSRLPTLDYDVVGTGILFEQLVLDILNENQMCAHRATAAR